MKVLYSKARLLLLQLCVLSSFALSQQVCGQDIPFDSLKLLIQQHTAEDSVRVELMTQLSGFYQSENLTKAEFFAASAVNLAFRIKNYTAACAAMSQLGSVYSWQRATARALNIYFRQKDLATRINSDEWLQDAYLGIGYVYELESDWDKALKYTIQALPYVEKMEDPFAKAFAYTNLGSEYTGLGNLEQADYYLRKAAVLYYDNDYIEQYANNEINIARLFIAKKQFDSARYHFKQADSIFTEWDEPYQVADVCQQLGDMYIQTQQYQLAKECYERTIKNYNKNDIPKADYALAKMGLGVVALAEKKYDSASYIFHQEFPNIKAANIISQQLKYLRYMSAADSALDKYAEAYAHANEYIALKEWFINEDKVKASQRMMVELGVQEKEKEYEQLKMQNELQKQRTVLFAIMGIILLIVGIYLASMYRQKAVALASIKELQLATEAKNQELAVINAIREKLISMIAHDVRSPLTSLQNTLYLTREKIINEEEFMQLSKLLDNDISHLISMLDNTLLWAREQIYVLNIDKAEFNLHEIVEDVLILYKKAIQDKRLLVKNNIPVEMSVVSDREIIHTVLRNVLSNAIKFTPENKQISINAYPAPGEVMIHVKDEGSGISYSILEKISKKEFISTRGTNNEKGTGLGLMFSYDLLAKLNESLTIRTEPGEGTTVIFSITQSGGAEEE